MTNISLGEITELREFLTTAHNHLRTIERVAEPEDGTGTQESSGQFNYTLRTPGTTTFTSAAIDTSGLTAANTSHRMDESLNSNNMDLF